MTELPQASSQAPVSKSELKEQIQQTIQDATQAARDAAEAQRDAARAQRDGARNGILIPPFPQQYAFNDIPPRIEGVAYGFFFMCAAIVIGWPLSRALGRRIERRPDAGALGPAASDQLHRIEQAVEAMAIEVERISESQRYIARIQGGAGEPARDVPSTRR